MDKPNKRRVKISPEWLDVMVPPVWVDTAETLAAMAAERQVSPDRMRLFITAGRQMPLPLVEAVRAMIAGEITLEVRNADTAHEPPPPRSGLILPPKHHA